MTSKMIYPSSQSPLPPLSPIDINKSQRRRPLASASASASASAAVADHHNDQLDGSSPPLLAAAADTGEGPAWGIELPHHRNDEHEQDISPNAAVGDASKYSSSNHGFHHDPTTTTFAARDCYTDSSTRGRENDAPPEETIEPRHDDDGGDDDDCTDADDADNWNVPREISVGSPTDNHQDAAAEQYFPNANNSNNVGRYYNYQQQQSMGGNSHGHHHRHRHPTRDHNPQQSEYDATAYMYHRPVEIRTAPGGRGRGGGPTHVAGTARTPPMIVSSYNPYNIANSNNSSAATTGLKKRSRPQSSAAASVTLLDRRSSSHTPPLISSSSSKTSAASIRSRSSINNGATNNTATMASTITATAAATALCPTTALSASHPSNLLLPRGAHPRHFLAQSQMEQHEEAKYHYQQQQQYNRQGNEQHYQFDVDDEEEDDDDDEEEEDWRDDEQHQGNDMLPYHPSMTKTTRLTNSASSPPPERLYHHDDVRFWSYNVGDAAHPRSCHGSFGHVHPATRKDLNVWTVRDFDWGHDGAHHHHGGSSNILGNGNFGHVCRVRYRRKGGRDDGNGNESVTTYYAVKRLRKDGILQNEQSSRIVRREVEIQTRLVHPNVLRMEGYFHTRSEVFMVLEYANGGDLYNVLKRQQEALARMAKRSQEEEVVVVEGSPSSGSYDDDQFVAVLPHNVAAHIARQVAEALRYLRSVNIAHRDVKPENILLHYSMAGDRKNRNYMNAQIKLCDFGWSCSCPSPDANRRTTLCGTPEYISPELLQLTPRPEKRPRMTDMVGHCTPPCASEYDARYVDAWSLGVLVYELVTGQTPFIVSSQWRGRNANSDEAMFDAIRRFDDDGLDSLYVGPEIPREWKQFGRLVRGLVRVNPMERLSMERVLDHPWLNM